MADTTGIPEVDIEQTNTPSKKNSWTRKALVIAGIGLGTIIAVVLLNKARPDGDTILIEGDVYLDDSVTEVLPEND